ncbi:MAG: D-alanine--D-alanine ligase [Gammaproteobacteria bacterium]|nr:D-alanine--D-alanine ligase [Gammaproteobacteria bacterium]
MDLTVAVVAGGASAEADVSRSSAREVTAALKARFAAVEQLELDDSLYDALGKFEPDVVFPVLHGPPGEDGTVQGFLDIAGYPYVGSDVRGSAIAMDKYVAKLVFKQASIAVLDDVYVTRHDDVAASVRVIEARLGDRVVIKPTRQGSAIGVTLLPNGGDISAPLREALRFGEGVLVEPYALGKEITVGVLDLEGSEPSAFPVIEIKTATGEWYDFTNRYTPGKSEHVIPAPLPDELNVALQAAAITGHRSLGLRDLSRADFIVTDANEAFLLEINTLPGMTPTSLYPDGARANGMSFEDLMQALVHSAHRRAGAQ